MLRVIIIEDEKPAARRLLRMLAKENILVSAMLHSVSEAVSWLKQHPAPDLIFADIQLSDGISFDIFKQIPVQSAIIFTTAYDQYAIRAFKLNSIDYLLKPVKQDELRFALDKFYNNTNKEVDIQQLISTLKHDNSYKKRFGVQYGTHLQSIPVEEIAYFYSQDKTTWLVTYSGEEFIYDQALEKVEKQLNPESFFRINRQFILSSKAIKDMVQYTNSRLKIILHPVTQTDVIVARERIKDFKNWLGL